MRYQTRSVMYKGLLFSTVFLFPILLWGCGGEKRTDSDPPWNPYSDTTESAGSDVSEQEITIYGFSPEEYKEKLAENRIAISEYQEQYARETEEMQYTEYNNVDFADCKFDILPDTDEIEVLAAQDHGITAKESWDTIRDWLESIGKTDEVDMKTEARIVTQQFEWDETREFPYSYPSLYEHLSELESGAGAFISADTCHIQIAADGIYSMSDGKITEYLNSRGYESKASRDWSIVDYDTTEIVEKGTLSELGDRAYPLMNGEITVQEGAELVTAYFEAGTPFPMEENITIDTPEVSIFKVADRYGYEYIIRRIYKGIPFYYKDNGSGYYTVGNYMIQNSDKCAYVVDESGVTAYVGRNECEKLHTLISDDKILSLKDAAGYLNTNLASYLSMKVQTAELSYVGMSMDRENLYHDADDGQQYIYLPCWAFEGINETKGEKLWVYVDALTGEIYFHTDTIEK